MNLIDKVREMIKRYSMFEWGDKVIIGVSGGPDSICLLYLLYSLRDEFGLSLHIAHLDHMLRKDSYRDLLFVKNQAERLDLPFTGESINISKLAKRGSVEEIARKVRFDFLFRAAKEIGAKKIALGHNRDDQVETVLLRILRGSGLYGLQAILPKREIYRFTVIRPLIEVERREIEEYLRRKKIRTRKDITNTQVLYFRNRIRNELLPFLEKKYNPNIRQILFNMAENVSSDYEFLESESKKAFKRLKMKKCLPAVRQEKFPPKADLPLAKKINLNLEKILRYHPTIQRMVLRLAISALKGDTRRLSFKHFKELEDLIKTRPEGSIVDLPSKISVRKEAKYLSLYFR